MMDYSLHMLARSEHDLMVRSVPKVYDGSYQTAVLQSRWSRLIERLQALAGHVQISPPNPPHRSRPTLTTSNPSSFLRDQLREDSNYEMDWLWAAGQVTAPEESRYCLERALYINPDNPDTWHALSKLVARYAADEKQAIIRPGFAQSSNQ